MKKEETFVTNIFKHVHRNTLPTDYYAIPGLTRSKIFAKGIVLGQMVDNL